MPTNKAKMSRKFNMMMTACLAATGLALASAPARSQDAVPNSFTSAQSATYADLVSLAERSDMVVHVEIRRQIELKSERAPDVAPGFARLYIEARTLSLISSNSPVGEELVFLVDVPRDFRGKVEKLKDRQFLLFADAVQGRPGSIQLTGKRAMLDYTPALISRLRPILSELVSRERPPVVSGISDALAVQGTLAGESETQIFLATSDRSPVSMTVLRRPGQGPVWGVSWGEIIDSSARPPASETLRWYRLTCGLPAELPSAANLARDPAARRLAEADYAYVMRQIGPCERSLTNED